MSLPGRIGPYTVVRELGRGGMGVVHLGHDARLGREVAIKALPELFSRDPERVQRFEREARLLASLSHPNIAAVLGLEEQDGQRYLVLEYVPGETLAERLARGPIPADDAADLGRQIAAALEAAHEAGIVHRDLKPGNVKITPAGEVKVLDFGLAKGTAAAGGVSAGDLSHSPTLAVTATGEGVILGTAAYMSPEQARGKPVDRRTDIWSFGCVMYECLTGRRAFDGETASDMIALILQGKPDWDALPADTPPRLRALVERCLEKDAKQRLRDIGEARLALESPRAPISGVAVAPPAARPGAAGARLAWAVAAAFGIAAVVMAWRLASRNETEPVSRLSILPPPGVEVLRDPAFASLSPDGRTLAFVGNDSVGSVVWIRPFDETMPRRVPGTEGVTLCSWSPDGRAILFTTQEKLKRVDLRGGAPLGLCDVTSGGRGASWGEDGVIVFAAGGEGPLSKVAAGGGPPVAVTALDSNQTAHRFPEMLPGGRHFLYCALPATPSGHAIFVGSTDGKTREFLMHCDAVPRYVRPGWLVFTRNGRVMAQRFDAKRRRLVGAPGVLRDQVAPSDWIGASRVIASPGGTLAYLAGGPRNTELQWHEPGGRRTTVAIPEGRYTEFDVSADGSRIVVVKETSPIESDLWLVEPGRGGSRRLTFGPGAVSRPSLSPDASRVLYATASPAGWGISSRPTAGGEALRLPTPKASILLPSGWTPDGAFALVQVLTEKSGWDAWLIPADGRREGRRLLGSPYDELEAAVSPDGRWLAYSSLESGTPEIYLTSFPEPGSRYQVSRGGGQSAFWRADSRRLAYRGLDTERGWEVDLSFGDGVSASAPRPFFASSDATSGRRVVYGRVLPDFSKILLSLESEPAHSVVPITILQHWESALEPE